MDVYLLLLFAGFGGLMLITLLGLGHQSSTHSHGHGGGHAHGHGHGHGAIGCKGGHQLHHPANAHGSGVKVAKIGHSTARDSRAANFLFMLISPRVIFSLILGFGAVGVVLRPLAAHWPVIVLPLLAVLGAFGFEWYAVQPLWRILSNFASNPAQTLDSIVLEEGKAVTNFDATGHGVIAVDLDGQVRQLLGSLAPDERTVGERIRAGDRLFIRAIDAQRNSCTVSRLN